MNETPRAPYEFGPDDFGETPRLIATQGPISAHAFRFPSGVAALEIRNAAGRIIALPFQGQQIWDAWFNSRRLTMESLFPQPIPTRDYRATNGGFFVHCGGTAMGNPTPEDTHPLHGELPNLPLDRAWLTQGHDGMDDWMELAGEGLETTETGATLVFRPRLRLTGTGHSMRITIDLHNGGTAPLKLHYLAHANFRPMDGAELTGADAPPVMFRQPRLSADAPEADWVWHREVAQDATRHARIRAGDRIVNEFVATYAAIDRGDGWAEARQTHPDGRVDFLRHRARDLPFATRWMVRAEHRQACGFALPGTAPPDGRIAAQRDGRFITLAPGESFQTTIDCGAADRL